MNKTINDLLKKYLILTIILFILVLLFINCEQPSNSLNSIDNLYNFPNPFSPTGDDDAYKNTTIRAEFSNVTSVTIAEITVRIMDYNGSLVWYFNREIELSGIQGTENIDIIWSGTNNLGNYVSQGIYTADLQVQVLESSSNSIGGDILTGSIKIAVQ